MPNCEIVTRPTLALVRSQPAPPLLHVPSRRVILGLAVLGLALVGAYFVARQTTVFAVKNIEVRGGSSEVVDEVMRELEPYRGENLVGLNQEELGQKLRTLPSVASVEYDRAFPNTLEIHVRPERPIAVIRSAQDTWLVSAAGRVIRAIDHAALPQLPRIWVPSPNELAPGARLTRQQKLPAIRTLANLPERFPFRIVAAREEQGEITLILSGDREIRLGEAAHVPLKLEIATRILRVLKLRGDAIFSYVDVSLPDRVVVG